VKAVQTAGQGLFNERTPCLCSCLRPWPGPWTVTVGGPAAVKVKRSVDRPARVARGGGAAGGLIPTSGGNGRKGRW